MGRKSAVKTAPDPIRSAIERLLREDRFSLDEVVRILREQFPEHIERLPSRSSIGRYRQSMNELVSRMREIDTVSRAVVAELGESPDERAGALLTQTITALATHVALKVSEDPDNASIGDVKELARATRNVMDARRVGLKERQEIEAAAQRKLVREQQSKLDGMVKRGAMSAETLARIRTEVYGLAPQ
jgi:hypothetical protein